MRFCTRKRIFYKNTKDPCAILYRILCMSQSILYINGMETNEIIAWFFIIFSVVVWLLKDTNAFCRRSWDIIKIFWLVLGAMLAFGYVKDKMKAK